MKRNKKEGNKEKAGKKLRNIHERKERNERKNMKVFNILFGILSIIVAIICFMYPFASQLVYGYIIAIFVGVMGIMCLVNYFTTRKTAKASGIQAASGTANLAIGIFGVVFMLLNMTVPFFNYSVQEFAAILVSLFMLVEGISCIAGAFTNKDGNSMGMRILTGIFGVLMVIAFVYALACPAIIISMFGIFLGACMLVQGVSRIALAFSLS